MVFLPNWSEIFEQMNFIGKFLLKDDIKDFGMFDRLHHWQYGFVLWALSEYLSLINIFFPFDQQILKAKVKAKINRMKRDAEQKMARTHKQYDFRRERFRYT